MANSCKTSGSKWCFSSASQHVGALGAFFFFYFWARIKKHTHTHTHTSRITSSYSRRKAHLTSRSACSALETSKLGETFVVVNGAGFVPCSPVGRYQQRTMVEVGCSMVGTNPFQLPTSRESVYPSYWEDCRALGELSEKWWKGVPLRSVNYDNGDDDDDDDGTIKRNHGFPRRRDQFNPRQEDVNGRHLTGFCGFSRCFSLFKPIFLLATCCDNFITIASLYDSNRGSLDKASFRRLNVCNP